MRILFACAVLIGAPAFAVAQAIDPADTCEGKEVGAACWLELQSHRGCYVWNDHLQENETATWTGSCTGDKGEGEGALTFAGGYATEFAEGQLEKGKRHGQWVLQYGSGEVLEGPYANGNQVGRWKVRYANGNVAEGLLSNGRMTGRWVEREVDGDVVETPYVDDKKHGTEVRRWALGGVLETPWVNGRRHGTEVLRLRGVGVVETPWVNGKRHGTEVERDASGRVISEIQWINGEKRD